MSSIAGELVTETLENDVVGGSRCMSRPTRLWQSCSPVTVS